MGGWMDGTRIALKTCMDRWKSMEGWNTSHMRKGWKSWGCSAWRREGSSEILFWPFSTERGLI